MWPQGKGRIVMATRGFFLASFSEDKTKDFLLKIRIKGLTSKQAELEYPLGVELEVLQDDFGIFEHHKKMFFAGTPHGGLMVHRVETRDYDSPGAPSSGIWGGWGEDGFTMPLVFFAKRPGTGIGMGDKSPDILFFEGQEKSPLGHKDSLHFQRKVEPSKKKPGEELDEIDKGFIEDTWFAKGIGLVHLVQKIDNEISMEWILLTFLTDEK